MTTLLTEADKSRARHHLGYVEVQTAQTFVLGVPAGVQTQFVIEGAFNRLLPSALPRFRQLLDRLDRVEELIESSTDDLEASSVGNITLNDKALARMLDRYRFWQGGLANLMGIQPNPNDQRWGGVSGMGGINVPVLG